MDTGGPTSPKSHLVHGTLYTKGETGNSGTSKPVSGGATQSNLGYLSAIEKDAEQSPIGHRTPSKLKLSVQKNLSTNRGLKDNGATFGEHTEDVATDNNAKRRK